MTDTQRELKLTLKGEAADSGFDVYAILLAELDSAFADDNSDELCIEIEEIIKFDSEQPNWPPPTFERRLSDDALHDAAADLFSGICSSIIAYAKLIDWSVADVLDVIDENHLDESSLEGNRLAGDAAEKAAQDV